MCSDCAEYFAIDVESRVASAARNVEAIRVSYDSVRGAQGQVNSLRRVRGQINLKADPVP